MSESWVDSLRVASHLQKSPYTIREWAKAGSIPGTKLGGKWMFQLSAIDAHLSAKPDLYAQSPQSRNKRRAT